MSTGGRIALSVAIVVVGGYGWLLLAWFFALYSCTWEASCSTRHHVTHWVLLAGGAVALVAVLRAVWRDRQTVGGLWRSDAGAAAPRITPVTEVAESSVADTLSG